MKVPLAVRSLWPSKVILKLLSLCVLPCIFGCLVAVFGSQSRPDGASKLVDPERIQGCYEITLSPWRPNLNLGEDAVFITPPSRIQLSAESGTNGRGAQGLIVSPAPGVKPSIHRGSYWLPKSPESIEIVWTTGFSGLVMNLDLDGADLRGKAKTFWDFDRERQTADAVARKVDCQEVRSAGKAAGPNCQPTDTQSKVIAGEGWGPVRLGAHLKTVDAFLGRGRLTGAYSKVFFKDYRAKGIQVSFAGDSGRVGNICFYNGQQAAPQFASFCGQVDKGISWQSTVEEVKKAYGKPTAEFATGSWLRLVFEGIDFRFEDGKMVRIGIPGR